jgi:hypothetical protein
MPTSERAGVRRLASGARALQFCGKGLDVLLMCMQYLFQLFQYSPDLWL